MYAWTSNLIRTLQTQGAIEALHAATPIEPGKPARYPGEGTLATREESLRLGVAVEKTQWKRVQELEAGD